MGRSSLRMSVHQATLARIRRALASEEPALRAEAIDGLAILGDERGLIDALAHGDPYVRRRAVRGLAERPGEVLTWRLAHRRFDDDEEVRRAVVAALARRRGFAGWLAAHALRRITEEDASAHVRFDALVALDASASVYAEAVLLEAFAFDPERFVREMARTLLARRGLDPGPAPDDPSAALQRDDEEEES